MKFVYISMFNLVFFGNTKYSTIVAKKLQETFGLTALVTIPNRPLGRKKILTPSPTKKFALEHNIQVLTFDKLDQKAITTIKNFNNRTMEQLNNVDFIVVADYGLFLPNELLKVPKFAPLNVHHSLLPKHRGPSPAPTAILNGEKVSGVTIIKMTEKVDAGDMLAQKEYMLKDDETTDFLLTKLNELGAELVVKVIQDYKHITPKKQDAAKSDDTAHIKKSDGYFDLKNPPSPEKLDRMIRAYYPWPNVWTKIRIRNKEIGIKFLPEKKMQVEGKKPTSYKDFLNGYPELKPSVEKLYGSNS